MSVLPVPQGRGRWRLTLHSRPYSALSWDQTIITQMDHAFGRQLAQQWNTPAQLTFSLDGHSSEAALINELATEVVAWRWDDSVGGFGQDVCMFRGVIDHSEDQLSEQSMTTTFVAHDYAAMMQRRYTTAPYSQTQADQDAIVTGLVNMAINTSTSRSPGNVPPPVSLSPGSWMPIRVGLRNPDGTLRVAQSGQLRDRVYPPQSQIYQLLDDLSQVINGYDWTVRPFGGGSGSASLDEYSVFYPNQGVSRTDCPLVYGSNVSALTRTVASADYANYWRVIGNNASSDPNADQVFSEAWNSDANNVTVNPVGLWMSADNAADVTIQATLDQQAQGNLNLSGLLVPSYTLSLRPNTYVYRQPNIGDTVPLIILAGRLNVNTTIRVMGISYGIGDDGDEDVSLTVGRAPTTLASLFTQADRDVNALTRR